MIVRRTIFALVLLLALAPGRGRAQSFGKNKVQYRDFQWEVLTSAHFEVYYYQGERQLADDVVAIAERANILLSRDLAHRLTRRIPIVVYNSHNDFSQTNITSDLVDEGTGGFTEVFKTRVVIPFTGSYEELRHVLVHELTHAFQYDILYGGPFQSLFGRSGFINVPLWMAEGQAEFESLGIDASCEQFMRDGIIHGYLIPIQYEPGGYIVYKEGQSMMAYIFRKYGREKYAELLHRIRGFHNVDRALEKVLGVNTEKLNTDWMKELKKQYWPTVAKLDDPEKFARRLTDHGKDRSYLNMAPAISPDGGKVAYISDRHMYTDLYIMSAIDGRIIRRVVRGTNSSRFESIPVLRSAISWSPDGSRLAFVAKSGAHDVIYLYNVAGDEVEREFQFDFDGVSHPAFSPDGRQLAFAALKDGMNDLYLLDLDTSRLRRLTHDRFDEVDVTFAPDGRLTFASDRHHRLTDEPIYVPGGSGTYGIYSMALPDTTISEVLFTGNNDTAPAWSRDGRQLAFISQRDRSQNLYVYSPADSTITQITDVIGGIYNVSWSEKGDRMVFSALNDGGWDVFASKDPLASDSTLAALRKASPDLAYRLGSFVLTDGRPYRVPEPLKAPVVGAAADTADSVKAVPAPRDAEGGLYRTGSLEPDRGYGRRGRSTGYDSLRVRQAAISWDDSVRAEAIADSASLLSSYPYKTHYTPDYLTGGAGYNTVIGFAGSAELSISDFLGNHRFYLVTDLFTSSLDETNFLAVYNSLAKRTDVSFGIYHVKNYFYSRITSLGEEFPDARYFSERQYGAVGEFSYPFSKFQRLEVSLPFEVVRRTDLEPDQLGYLVVESDTTNIVAAPSLSLVGDNTLDGYFGPVDGTRWMLSASQALPLGGTSLSYTTLSLSYLKYFSLARGYSLAFRAQGWSSFGRNPQNFFLGGPTTIRGYDSFYSTDQVDVLSGHNAGLMNLEFRFPFITHLGLAAPLPISLFNIQGVAFADAGAAWNSSLRVFSNDGGFHLVDPRASYGVGIRAALYYFLVRLDLAWPTQVTTTNPNKNPKLHFSIGAEF